MEEEKAYFRNKRALNSHNTTILSLDSIQIEECKKGLMVVKGYVSGIVDLWEHQRLMEGNTFPHPRTNTVTKLLQRIEIQKARTKEISFVDRGIGTMQDLVNLLYYIAKCILGSSFKIL